MSEKLVLIDGHSILNRAFYGVPDLSNSEGLHTNAIYGFLNILFKLLEEEKPEYLTVAFDVKAPTFRHEMYPEYKGTRKPMPQELHEQVPVMKQVLHAMGIRTMEQPGLEADDILGTLAKRAEKEGMDVSLVSGDRDLLQIASDKIKIRIPKTKGARTEVEDYYAADVEAKYGVTPAGFIELKALMGDTADNIPGVPKVGEKTASELLDFVFQLFLNLNALLTIFGVLTHSFKCLFQLFVLFFLSFIFLNKIISDFLISHAKENGCKSNGNHIGNRNVPESL